MMPLDHALETAAFADAHDIHKSLAVKNVDQYTVSGFHCAVAIRGSLFVDLDRHLANDSHRRQIVLSEMTLHWLGQTRFLHKFHQTDLGGDVAVFGRGLVLGDHARPGLQHGSGMQVALVVEELRHADLFSQDSSYLCHFLLHSQLGQWLLAGELRLLVLFTKRFDLDVDTRGEIKLHQRIHGLLRRLENVKQALVGANFKLLAGLLVHVWLTQYAIFVLYRGQWNRARDLRASAPGGLDDLTRGLVQDAVVVRLQPDSDSLFSYHVSLSIPPRHFPGGKNW